MKTQKLKAGVLLHPTSLPSPFGVGDLGKNAYSFIDCLSKAHVSLWQILPLGPTGYGDSPYAVRSTFAGNELLIDLKSLCVDGLLDFSDVIIPEEKSERVDYGKARSLKMPLIEKAAKTFLAGKKDPVYAAFCRENAFWLDDYALYQALASQYNDSRWFLAWPKGLKFREEDALKAAIAEHKDEIERYKVAQYFFFSQWKRLKAYANEHGVKIIGDIPIFVASDSVDAWTHTDLLKMDRNCNQKVSSGVPPDAFSATGQLWGNPIYDWKAHEKTGFAWWISRVKGTLKVCDIIRIDHFRGLEACWEVPAEDTTAENGKWVKSPGEALLSALEKECGSLPLIAEDLGVITPEVEALRDSHHLPGMKIMQFAFGFQDGKWNTSNAYLPQHIGYESVAYTGTHDNNTTRGWYDALDDGTKDYIRRYLECGDDDIVYKMIRALLSSHAKYVVVPMQDVLALGEEARMNVPATCGSSNWSWKMDDRALNADVFDRYAYYINLYGRG